MKTSLNDIPSEQVHNNTVYKKQLISASEKNGQVATYNYAWMQKGRELTAHTHTDGEEYYLFLEGAGEMLVGKEWFLVKKGDFVVVPRNNIHSVKNHNEQNLVFTTLRIIVK